MTINEIIAKRRKQAKESCEARIVESIENGKFTARIFTTSVEDRKLYVECMQEIAKEMKGSGYHLKIVVTNEDKDVFFDFFVIRDEPVANGK